MSTFSLANKMFGGRGGSDVNVLTYAKVNVDAFSLF